MQDLANSADFHDKLIFNLIDASGRALTNAAINGEDLEGETFSDQFQHKLAHALVGCAAGAAAGGACRDGAIGAAIAETVAELIGKGPNAIYTEEEKRRILTFSKLSAGVVAAYTGGNAQTAINTGGTAVENNHFIVVLAGAAWLVDKAWTVADVISDLLALSDGTKTINQIVLEKGEEYVVRVLFTNAGKVGIQIVKKTTGWEAVSENIKHIHRAEIDLRVLAKQQQRHAEIIAIISDKRPTKPINIDGQEYFPRPGQAVPIYDGPNEEQIKKLFLELTGQTELPTPINMTTESGHGIRYTVETTTGNYTLQDLANSTDTSGPVWSIDIPRTISPPPTKKQIEIKFKKS